MHIRKTKKYINKKYFSSLYNIFFLYLPSLFFSIYNRIHCTGGIYLGKKKKAGTVELSTAIDRVQTSKREL